MTKRFHEKTNFTYAQVEGALCVFDWMIDQRVYTGSEISDAELLEHAEDITKTITNLWDNNGSPGMRLIAAQAGALCDAAYQYMKSIGLDFDTCYDFEFVPAICEVIDWAALEADAQYNSAPYRPKIKDLFEAARPRLEPHLYNVKLDGFQSKARYWAQKLWGYADLVSDHPEKVESAARDGEDPKEFTQWLGEKYGLIPLILGD